MRRSLPTLVAVSLIGVILFGCGTGAVPGNTNERESAGRTEDSSGPRDEADGHELPEPPGSTLSYGGETVSGALGSYCWVSVCTDAFGVPVSEEALTVPAGSTVTFAYGGRKLDSLSASAHRIGRGTHLEKVAGDAFLVPNDESIGYKTIRLQTRRSGERALIAAELPAGEYVVEAFARFPEGDAFYGFRVIVE